MIKSEKIKNYNYLILVKENISYFGVELLKYLDNAYVLFYSPHEELFSQKDFKKIKRNYKNKAFGSAKIFNLFKKYKKHKKKYLCKFESFYKNGSLNYEYSHIYHSQIFSMFWHHRNYFQIVDEDDIKLLTLACDTYYEYILEKYKIDVVLDFIADDFWKYRIFTIANKKNLPYLSLNHSKFRNYVLISDNFTQETDADFKKFYTNILQEYDKNNSKFNDAKKEFFDYKCSNTKLNTDERIFRKNLRRKSLLSPFKFLNFLKNFLLNILPHGLFFNYYSPFLCNPLKRILFEFLYCFRLLTRYNIYYFKFNSFKPNGILLPLHYLPESSTFTQSKIFFNEKFIIEIISKFASAEIPINIKEHISMVPERPYGFYIDLAKLSRICILNPLNSINNPEIFIKNSKLVICLNGTSGLESQFFGVPSLIFGSVPYDVIDSVYKTFDINEILNILRLKELKKASDQELICFIYSLHKNAVDLNYGVISKSYIYPKDVIYKNIINYLKLIEIKLS